MATNKHGKYRIGIYAGTFDPVTKGHMHIVKRAKKLVDHLIVAVAENAGKNPVFTMEERIELIRHDVNQLECKDMISVKGFDNLLVHFAKQEGASVIFRGLRAVSDFEYEFQMTGMNAQLDPDVETLFLMASDKHQYVSSAFVKEICRLGGDVAPFLSETVTKALKKKLKK